MKIFLLTVTLSLLTKIIFAQCSGTPIGGVAHASATSFITPCDSILLFVTQSSYSANNGYQIQWEENYNGGGWVNIGAVSGIVASSGSSDSTFISGMPSSPNTVQFRRRIICPYSSVTSYSSFVTFVTALHPNS